MIDKMTKRKKTHPCDLFTLCVILIHFKLVTSQGWNNSMFITYCYSFAT